MQSVVSKVGTSPKRLKRKSVKTIPAKARLQYGDKIVEVAIQVPESGVKKMTNIVDRLVSTGSTSMRKYINVKIMDFKNKSREVFPEIPSDTVVVFRDVHQMADIIFGKHLAKIKKKDVDLQKKKQPHEEKKEDEGDNDTEKHNTLENSLYTSCDIIWQLVSTRSDDFCPKLYIDLCVCAAKVFWLVSTIDAGIQLLWRKMDVIAAIGVALKKFGKQMPFHKHGHCIYELLYKELDYHDPDIQNWSDLSKNSVCGGLLLSLRDSINAIGVSSQTKEPQQDENNDTTQQSIFKTILASISILLNKFGNDFEDGIELATFASDLIHHPDENVWLSALYASAMTLKFPHGRRVLCESGSWDYIMRIVSVADELGRGDSVQKLGVATFHNYVAMALNGFTSGAIQMQLKSKTRNVKIDLMNHLPETLSTEDTLGAVLFRLSSSLNVITSSTTCATIANLVSLGVTLSVDSFTEFLKVIERPAAPDVCIATASALSTALISQNYQVVDVAGANFFFKVVVALGKRMKYGCEPATQRYLAASILSLCDKNTIPKLENHMLLHKLVETVARLPSFAEKGDWLSLNYVISSLWCLAKSTVCCSILADTELTPSLMKIMIKLSARDKKDHWNQEEKDIRKRIVGLFFLMTVSNMKTRHAVLAEVYATEVIQWLEDSDYHIVTWTCAMFWDAFYTSPKLAEELLPYGILKILVHIASKHKGVTHLTRQFAAGALEAIADAHPHALEESNDEADRKQSTLMEKLYISLLSEDDTKLEEIACRGLGDLALYEHRAEDLVNFGAIARLGNAIEKALRFIEDDYEKHYYTYVGIVRFGVNALRNMSMWQVSHMKLAKGAIKVLLHVLKVLVNDPVVADDVECAVYNISRNPKTFNILYQAQLKLATTMHKLDKEEELRKLLDEKGARSKQMKRRIIDSGACDEVLNQIKQKDGFSTIWDNKRIGAANNAWITCPLAAQADVVMADDKVRLKPIITLESIIRRPVGLTLASQKPRESKYRYGNVWLPKISSYETPLNKMVSSEDLLTATFNGEDMDMTTGKKKEKKFISCAKSPGSTLNKITLSKSASVSSINEKESRASTTNDDISMKKGDPFTVHLKPDNAHNECKIVFKDHASPGKNQRVRMAKWPASIDSTNAKSGIPIFKLPDGTLTHYYCKSDLQPGRHPGHPHRFPGALVLTKNFPGVHPEVDFPILRGTLQPPEPFSQENLTAYTIESEKRAPLKCEKTNIPYEDTSLLLKIQLKKKSSIRKKKDVGDKKAYKNKNKSVADLDEDDDYTDEELFDDSGSDSDGEEEETEWSLFKSVFRGRERHSESRDFYDREDWLRGRMLDIDWKRLLPNKDWGRLVDGGDEVLIHEMQDAKDIVSKLYDPICDCFEHYAIINTKVSVISFKTFKMFLEEFGLISPINPFLNMQAHEKTFIIANKEETGTLDEETRNLNRANDDRSLMRFEWLHAITRIAYAKYCQSEKLTSDTPTALKMLVNNDIIPQLDPDSRDSNQFRKDFLYHEDIDIVYRSNVATLQGVWKRFSTKSRHEDRMVRRMTLKDWLHVWTALTFFDETFNKQQAKLVFERSKMKVVDDWKDAARGRVLCFEDFLEGCARIANIVPIPTNEEIESLGCTSAGLALRAMHNNGTYRKWAAKWYQSKHMYGDMRKMTEKLTKFINIVETRWSISQWNPENANNLY
eukprot:g5089.t1